ncbi:uncharacterized protein H6S33_004189 [Morchella sextelata]|jgi:hypothetical protein|uniref:uncharacterized protein n=1 Tax=Morchella sextelata TaxID=1174677 RepID=UPI001D045E0A|nr:uncharacterized protein H6S33_004189 [Morchella sextelata]KAH0605732.1 hypothetical protein H6S33_004189 [Morchella sextelata]
MLKFIPILFLSVLLLTFTTPTTALEGSTICETSWGSPLASDLTFLAGDFENRVIPGGRGPCFQLNDSTNGRPGCTGCWGLGRGSLHVSICGAKGALVNFIDIAAALRRLELVCTKTLGGNRRTGGKWRVKGGHFEILAHV